MTANALEKKTKEKTKEQFCVCSDFESAKLGIAFVFYFESQCVCSESLWSKLQ